MSKSYGSITWWGFSPAVDLLELISSYTRFIENNNNEINILLVGGADGRHIIKTISRFRNTSTKINFYMEESSLELIARQMLLLELIFESNENFGVQERSELFLEILGNSLIRKETADYIRTRSNNFIRLVTDPSAMAKERPYLDISNLKFKEIDQLEAIFKFWRNDSGNIFDIKNLWETRTRQFLGSRYDFRENSYDWEYSMNLKEKAFIVNWHHYKNWRESGIAYCIRDQTAYESPNKTLASGLIFMKDGERLYRRGYWGDIMNSPYITFGIDSHDKSLFVRNNNVHTKTETDVALFNVNAIISDLISRDCNSLSEKEQTETSDGDILQNVKISFLPVGSTSGLCKKSKFKEKFHLLYFSNSMVHLMDNNIRQLLRPKGLVMVESTKFMLNLKSELHKEYSKKIKNMAKEIGCDDLNNFDAETNNYGIYQYS